MTRAAQDSCKASHPIVLNVRNKRGETLRDQALSEIVIRFLVGGAVVTVFAMAGDLLKPKTFAGLFGAAPSVALATLGLTILKHGKSYAAMEARSMTLGAAALFVYCVLVTWLLKRDHLGTLAATTSAAAAWFATAFGLWCAFLR